MYPLLKPRARVYPAVANKFWKFPFLVRFYPLGTSWIGVPRAGSRTPPVGDCSSPWLLSHDETTTSRIETTNGPDPLKRDQHVISLRDQHTA